MAPRPPEVSYLGSPANSFLLLELSAAADTSGTAGTAKTGLLSGWGVLLGSRGVANVLMVTTTEGMLHGVHGNTTDLGPLVTLDAVLVVGTASLEHGLIHAAAAADNADHGAARGEQSLLQS